MYSWPSAVFCKAPHVQATTVHLFKSSLELMNIRGCFHVNVRFLYFDSWRSTRHNETRRSCSFTKVIVSLSSFNSFSCTSEPKFELISSRNLGRCRWLDHNKFHCDQGAETKQPGLGYRCHIIVVSHTTTFCDGITWGLTSSSLKMK